MKEKVIKMKKISVVVSCYNEEKTLPLFYKEIIKTAKEFKNEEFEFIFVNDGSKDKTLEIIKELRKKDNRVRYISFSRNFGKEAAMMAGLEASKGDYVTFMDSDLQDPPSLLKEMYKYIIEEGFDGVGTKISKRNRKFFIRNFFTKIFYKLINKMSKVEMVDGARDYVLITRQVADAIISVKEYNRYFKGLFNFVGYDIKWIEYENVERVAGESNWSFWKLFVYAIEAIVGFSTLPLAISSIIGIMFFFISLILIIFIITKTLIFGDPTSGWPSLACIIFFVSGIQLFSIGIIGQYLSKTYLEVKNRPIYIVKETEESK